MRHLALALVLVGLPVSVDGQTRVEFDHLKVEGNRVETTHALPLALSVPPGLAPLGERHFVESYGGPAFRVSAAAWTDDSLLVAVHAETLVDGAGGLDYSGLDPDSLAGISFTSRTDCFDLHEETPEDIEANGFLRLLRDGGFAFDSAMALKRYFKTDPRGTAEVVLSYGRRLAACAPEGSAPTPFARRLDAASRRAFSGLAPIP